MTDQQILAASLRHRIEHGALPPGSLRTAQEFADDFEVTTAEASEAVAGLLETGLLVLTGSGAYWVAHTTEGSPARARTRGEVEHLLREDLAHGVYPPGSRLPTAAELGKRLGVSHATVSLALNTLLAEQLIIAAPHHTGVWKVPSGPEDRIPGTAEKVLRVENWMTERINDGVFPAGARIPSRDAIAETCGVTVNIVQDAQRILTARGLITSRIGFGTVVVQPGSRDAKHPRGRDLAYDTLLEKINSGTLTPGDGLPARTALGDDLGIHPSEADLALRRLQREGLVTSDFESSPTHIAAMARKRLQDGSWPAGTRLPGPYMFNAWGYKPTNVAKGIRILEAEGLVSRESDFAVHVTDTTGSSSRQRETTTIPPAPVPRYRVAGRTTRGSTP